MKIINLKQKKLNIYEVEVEKIESFLLFDETILKYNLLVGKVIDDNLIKEIKNYNNIIEKYFLVIKKIKQKLRSKKEIIDFLKKEELKEKEINIIIEKLEKTNLLNENNYISAYINDKLKLTLVGPNKIRQELSLKGINISDINKYLDEIDNDVWISKINKIISKKIKSSHKYSNQEIKRRLESFLILNGYSKEMFVSLLIVNNNEEDAYKKEYDKLYRKYSKKIDDEYILKNKIKQELYRKGFKQ